MAFGDDKHVTVIASQSKVEKVYFSGNDSHYINFLFETIVPT